MNEETKKLIGLMPHVQNYSDQLSKLSQWWQKVTMIGKINSREIAATLIDDMDNTRHKLEKLQESLMYNIANQNKRKLETEISAIAQVSIDILIRNLFERTADVGFLATDDDLRAFLQPNSEIDVNIIIERLHEYTLKYSVYDEVIILDPQGKVKVHLDEDNPITQSFDPLIKETITSGSPYIETFRHSDLQPKLSHSLIYSAPITQSNDPGSKLLGVLCLCFRFDNEMESIFSNLQKSSETIAILDKNNRIIASNDHSKLALKQRVAQPQSNHVELINYKGQSAFSISATTSGYQGFKGLSWQGYVMLSGSNAFAPNKLMQGFDESIFDSDFFPEDMKEISQTANSIIDDLVLVVINGQIISAKKNATEFMPVLTEIRDIGSKTKSVFDESIHNLYTTVCSSLLNEIQFQAALAVDIMDRNLYERANDVRWWALTTKFRELMNQGKLKEQDTETLSSVLAYINELYTVYTNLFIYDLNGKIIAISNAEETDIIGHSLDLNGHYKAALNLKDSQRYVVSPFESTDLYKKRHTYIYVQSIMSIDDSKAVGGIGIVFDSEPEFLSMLNDSLPRNEKGTIIDGAFGIFCGQDRIIISSTNPNFSVGDKLGVDEKYLALEQGQRMSSISLFEEGQYAIGAAKSQGYREYKTTGDYTNDVTALIFIPI